MQDLLVDLCHIHREKRGKDNLQLLCGVVETVLFTSLVAMQCKHSGQFVLPKMSPTQPEMLAMGMESTLKWCNNTY